ncbi:MAG TPA: DNA-3-methyladenine glycosylase I, partial [Polyangiales bacterium]
MVKTLDGEKTRCAWAGSDPLMIAYHDLEWGVPVHDDRKWFEKLVLDGAQAGLSWSTILRKRDGYRVSFAQFDPAKVARFSAEDVERLMLEPAIVRNRLKIESTIKNARGFLAVQKEFGSFDAYIWSFVEGTTQQNKRRRIGDIPAKTALSDAISKALKKRGFSFVGSTIVYSIMQAAGLVNDHLVSC